MGFSILFLDWGRSVVFGISRLFFGEYLGAPRVLLVFGCVRFIGFEVSSVAAR